MKTSSWQTMKCFRLTEAERLGVSPFSVIRWLKRGAYHGKIRIERKNPRVVMVKVLGKLNFDPHGRRFPIYGISPKDIGFNAYQRLRRQSLYQRGLTAYGTPRKYRPRRQTL